MLVKQVRVCSPFVGRYLLPSFFSFFSDLAVAMPRIMWPAEAENFLIEEWHAVLKSTQGVMMTKAEKVDLVLKKLNGQSKENEWDLDLSTDQIVNKLDTLSKKARRTYDKFRKSTSTGSAVNDLYDLQAAYQE